MENKRIKFYADWNAIWPVFLTPTMTCYIGPTAFNEKVFIGAHEYSYSELKDRFTWQDGTPCGVMEGGEE